MALDTVGRNNLRNIIKASMVILGDSKLQYFLLQFEELTQSDNVSQKILDYKNRLGDIYSEIQSGSRRIIGQEDQKAPDTYLVSHYLEKMMRDIERLPRIGEYVERARHEYEENPANKRSDETKFYHFLHHLPDYQTKVREAYDGITPLMSDLQHFVEALDVFQ